VYIDIIEKGLDKWFLHPSRNTFKEFSKYLNTSFRYTLNKQIKNKAILQKIQNELANQYQLQEYYEQPEFEITTDGNRYKEMQVINELLDNAITGSKKILNHIFKLNNALEIFNSPLNTSSDV